MYEDKQFGIRLSSQDRKDLAEVITNLQRHKVIAIGLSTEGRYIKTLIKLVLASKDNPELLDALIVNASGKN